MAFDFGTSNNKAEQGSQRPQNMNRPTIEPARTSRGFSNLPQEQNKNSVIPMRPTMQQIPHTMPKRSFDWSVLPWRTIIMVCIAIVTVVLLWVFREEISSFLSEVLSWIIMIIIIVIAVRWFLFGGRRR